MPVAAISGVFSSSVVMRWSAPAASRRRMISGVVSLPRSIVPKLAWPPLAAKAATHRGVAPRMSPVPTAKGSNAPRFGVAR